MIWNALRKLISVRKAQTDWKFNCCNLCMTLTPAFFEAGFFLACPCVQCVVYHGVCGLLLWECSWKWLSYFQPSFIFDLSTLGPSPKLKGQAFDFSHHEQMIQGHKQLKEMQNGSPNVSSQFITLNLASKRACGGKKTSEIIFILHVHSYLIIIIGLQTE